MVEQFAEGQQVNDIPGHACFGCGDSNPIGLQLAFCRHGDGVIAHVQMRPDFEGYAGMIHGGVVSTALDEAMSWAVIASGHLAVTAKMNVEFRQPVPVGAELDVYGEVTRDRGRAVEARGELRDRDGVVFARSTSLFIRVSAEQQQAWESTYFGGESMQIVQRTSEE